ncbi:MAG: hypothetical protein QOF74_2334 [Caballeronia mineralivorans]|nr:hypothetical protein [Caballeronia mineralivorans]
MIVYDDLSIRMSPEKFPVLPECTSYFELAVFREFAGVNSR